MSTIDVTETTFGETLSANDIVLVDFWADWCGPCKQFAPTYAASSEQHPDVVFAKVDTEAEQQLSAAAGIQSIPTLMAFREGVLVFSQPGALMKSEITKTLLRRLTMPSAAISRSRKFVAPVALCSGRLPMRCSRFSTCRRPLPGGSTVSTSVP